MPAAPVLVWFRNDLRLSDHPALHAAAATGRPILPLFAGLARAIVSPIVPSGTIRLSIGPGSRIFPDLEGRVLDPKQIGQLVRGTRRAQGLRQDQLAAAAGVGVRFLVEVERGKPTAQLGKVLAVLDALGCTLRIEPPPGVDDVQVGQ